jgi:hypothetical protein
MLTYEGVVISNSGIIYVDVSASELGLDPFKGFLNI